MVLTAHMASAFRYPSCGPPAPVCPLLLPVDSLVFCFHLAFFPTGSMLSYRTILTAAHCFTGGTSVPVNAVGDEVRVGGRGITDGLVSMVRLAAPPLVCRGPTAMGGTRGPVGRASQVDARLSPHSSTRVWKLARCPPHAPHPPPFTPKLTLADLGFSVRRSSDGWPSSPPFPPSPPPPRSTD